MNLGKDELKFATASARDSATLSRKLDGKRYLTRLGHYCRSAIFLNIIWMIFILLLLYVSEQAAVGGTLMAATLLYNPTARSVCALMGWFPARLYGAVGDGTDESSLLQSALDAANTAGAGKVLLKANTTYRIVSLTLRAQVDIEGVNWSSTLKSVVGPAAATKMLLGGSAVLRCNYTKFTLDANDEANVCRGFDIQGNGTRKFIHIDNVRVLNFSSATGVSPHGGGAAGIYTWTTDGVKITNSEFEDCQYSMFLDSPGPDCVVGFNRIGSSTATGGTMRGGIIFRRTSNGYSGSLCIGNDVSGVRLLDAADQGTEGHGIQSIRASGMRIIGNRVRDCATAGIHVGAGSFHSVIHSNIITQCGQRQGAGIYVELFIGVRTLLDTGASTTLTSDAVIPANATGGAAPTSFTFTVTSATGITSPGTLILNDLVSVNVIAVSGTTITAIAPRDGGQTVVSGSTVKFGEPDVTIIANNDVGWCTTYGISLSYSPGTIVTGNTVHDNGNEGIFSDSAKVNIHSNVVWNNWTRKSATPNPTTAPNVKSQIRVTSASGASRPSIQNNNVFDSQPTATSDYGIAVSDQNAIIGGNDCTGHLIAPIFESGGGPSNTVSDNAGYATSAGGTASVANAGTISHGLAKTPTKVTVTPTVSGRIAGISAVSSTTITLLLTDAAGVAIAVAENVRWTAEA